MMRGIKLGLQNFQKMIIISFQREEGEILFWQQKI